MRYNLSASVGRQCAGAGGSMWVSEGVSTFSVVSGPCRINVMTWMPAIESPKADCLTPLPPQVLERVLLLLANLDTGPGADRADAMHGKADLLPKSTTALAKVRGPTVARSLGFTCVDCFDRLTALTGR